MDSERAAEIQRQYQLALVLQERAAQEAAYWRSKGLDKLAAEALRAWTKRN